MKKNILLLINGFGIEQADSVNVYDEKLMPNMDRLTKEKLFASLASKDLDYKDGKVYTLTESASNKYIFGKLFNATKIVGLAL